MTKLYYLVKWGNDLLSQAVIDENRLEQAIYAKVAHKPFNVPGGIIDGARITIRPDYHSYTGWNPSYVPRTAEDIDQMSRDCPKALETFYEEASERVKYLMQTKREHEIGTGVELNLLETRRNPISGLIGGLTAKFNSNE